MKEVVLPDLTFFQVAPGKSFCAFLLYFLYKDKKLRTCPFNLYCIESNLPVSLHTSKTNWPHLQKQASKSRFLLLSDKLKYFFLIAFFKESVKKKQLKKKKTDKGKKHHKLQSQKYDFLLPDQHLSIRKNWIKSTGTYYEARYQFQNKIHGNNSCLIICMQ